MGETHTLSPMDPCPACGGGLHSVRAATPAEWAAFTDRENPRPLPPRVDSLDPARVADLGALYACGGCGYKHRQA